jgi:hypothetical protein
MWGLFEPIHDVVYFTPEVRAAADAIGTRGFWMGYFAFRMAPLGPVGPAPATAICHGFHLDRVSRALPDAWTQADPAAALAARSAGVDAALRRLWGTALLDSPEIAEAAELAWRAAAAADCAGRPLAAANQILPRPADAHLALWQAATTLREHRGDGHVAVLVANRIGPAESHVLKVAAGESDEETLRAGRMWPDAAWEATVGRLRDDGLIDAAQRLTAAGRALHDRLEAQTDAAAETPWATLGDRDTSRLADLLDHPARRIVDAGIPPSVNPVGLRVEPGTAQAD